MPKEHEEKEVCSSWTNHQSDSGFLQSWPEASEEEQEWVEVSWHLWWTPVPAPKEPDPERCASRGWWAPEMTSEASETLTGALVTPSPEPSSQPLPVGKAASECPSGNQSQV